MNNKWIVLCLLFILIAIIVIVVAIANNLLSNNYIDVENYQIIVDNGTLTDNEYTVFLSILSAAESQTNEIKYSGDINKEKLITHLGLYYGKIDNLSKLLSWTSSTIILNLDIFEEFQENKIIVEARVDEALNHIKEGSDRYKLQQISKYIANRIVYTDGIHDPICALNGEGVCSTYAILFYKMASRLGIQAYICFGYDENEYHAWNMVELKGNIYYYDVTRFDNIVYNYIYIYNKTSWGRNFVLNNKWEGAKNEKIWDSHS